MHSNALEKIRTGCKKMLEALGAPGSLRDKMSQSLPQGLASLSSPIGISPATIAAFAVSRSGIRPFGSFFKDGHTPGTGKGQVHPG